MEADNIRKVAFYTLGCKTNQYDTQTIIEMLIDRGYEIVDFESAADIYVINTCTVTSEADKKSRQVIRKVHLKNPDSIIVVFGCYPQRASEDVLSIPGVNIVAGINNKDKLIEVIDNYCQKNTISIVSNVMNQYTFDEKKIKDHFEKTRAIIKIQDGCNQSCSYCIIPTVRGPVRSRPIRNVVSEALNLASAGFKEIVLTGINLALYGSDLDTNLLQLLNDLSSINEIKRIRLGSLEPNVFNEKFIDGLSNLQKLCPHYHIPLQSGSDDILKLMNRPYTTKQFNDIVYYLNSKIPGIAVTTDVMVGFPGESDSDFLSTYEFVRQTGFSRIHVFKYSERKNTAAANYLSKIAQSTKNARSKSLIALGESLEYNYMSKLLNKRVRVLVEGKSAKFDNCYEGYTDNYVNVAIKTDYDLTGKIVTVMPIEIINQSLVANFID